MIYLDNAATTIISQRSAEAAIKSIKTNIGNPGSIHALGADAAAQINNARRQILETVSVGVDKNIAIFTSCGSEANSMAILGMENYLRQNGFRHIITSKYEHYSVLNSMKEMERRGFDVTYLAVKNGVVSVDDFKNAVREDTGFASIMYMNNELGTLNDIKEIYKICKKRKIIFHSDCVQAYGSVDFLIDNSADMISISGHKVHAPKGIACLITKVPNLLSNIIFGGHQEYGLRPGTENVNAIVAFGAAVSDPFFIINRRETSDRFLSVFLRECADRNIGAGLNADSPTGKILSIFIDGVDAETLTMLCSKNEIYFSTGAACSSRSVDSSHVLKAIGLSDKEARSTIRVSFSRYNTVGEVQKAAIKIAECADALKKMA